MAVPAASYPDPNAEYDAEVEAVHRANIREYERRRAARAAASPLASHREHPTNLYRVPDERMSRYDYTAALNVSGSNDRRSNSLLAASNRLAVSSGRSPGSRQQYSDSGSNTPSSTPHIRFDDASSIGASSPKRGLGSPSPNVSTAVPISPLLGYEKGRVSSLLMSPIENSVMKAVEEDSKWIGENADIFNARSPIKFFIDNPESESTKFVYLNEVKDPKGLKFNPYNLVVVPVSEVKRTYYTMSSNGLTFVGEDGHSEFTPMVEWVRDSDAFKLIQNLRVFRQYRYWKTFKLWRNFVRQRRFQKVKKSLLGCIFTLHPMFQGCLKDVVGACQNSIQRARLFDVPLQATFSQKEFDAAQHEAKLTLKSTISTTAETIRARVQTLIDDIQNPERIKVTEIQKGPSRRTISLRQIMLLEKQKALERARKAQMVNAEIRMIGRLVRLVDYYVLEAYTEMALREVDLLVNTLQQDKSMLFRTELVFDPDDTEVHFSPDCDTVVTQLLETVRDVLAMLSKMPRVLFHQKFLQYIALSGMLPAELSETGPQIRYMLETSPSFEPLEQHINDSVSTSFTEAIYFAEVFKDLRPVYNFGLTWSIEDYRKDNVDVSELNLYKIGQDLQMLEAWSGEIEKMQTASTRGILLIDGKALRTGLRPIPEHAIADILNVLVDLTARKTSVLQNTLAESAATAGRVPHDLAEYVSLVGFLAGMGDLTVQCTIETQLVDSLYSLLEDHHATIPLAHVAERSMLHNTFKRFKATVQKAEAGRQELHVRYLRQLEKSVSSATVALDTLTARLDNGRFNKVESNPQQLLVELADIGAQAEDAAITAQRYAEYQGTLGAPVDATKAVKGILGTVSLYKRIWELAASWFNLMNTFSTREFISLEGNTDIKQPISVSAISVKALKTESPDHPVVVHLDGQIQKYVGWLPRLLELANPAMKPRHWARVFGAAGQHYDKSLVITMTQLIEFNVLSLEELIAEVSAVATGESEIDAALEAIEKAWAAKELVTVQHGDERTTSKKTVYILGPATPDLLEQAETDMLSLVSMLSSRYISGLAREVEAMHTRLSTIVAVLTEWMACQAAWLTLDAVFTAYEELAITAPQLAAKFRLVDRRWKMTMRNVNKASNLQEAVAVPGVLQSLVESIRAMDSISQGLSEFLDARRDKFPRFYFFSDRQLIEFLARSNQPRQITPLLSLLFEAVHGIELSDDIGATNPEIAAVISPEDERIRFGRHVQAFGPAEKWIAELQESLHKSLVSQVHRALATHDKYLRHDWIFKYPAQIVAIGVTVQWTREVEECLASPDPSALKKYRQQQRQQLVTLAEIVNSEGVASFQLAMAQMLMIIDLKHIAVVNRLIENKAATKDDYFWQRELRYYWDNEADTCVVRFMDHAFTYGFEYQGAKHPLVFTPLTERAFTHWAGALAAGCGGLALGPAASGKSETVKQMAHALGRQAIIVPGSATLGVTQLGRLVEGAAQAGAWLVLDNAHRMALRTLSVAAELIRAVFTAQAAKSRTVMLHGRKMPLVDTCNIFVTAQPAPVHGAPPTGFTPVPLSLQHALRSVSFAAPDPVVVAEVALYAEGFKAARGLASRLITLFQQCAAVTPDCPCEWGMRLLRRVASVAGHNKRRDFTVPEDMHVGRAVVACLPFQEGEYPAVDQTIRAAFGKLGQSPPHEILLKAVLTELEARGLSATPAVVGRVLALREALLHRRAVVVVGPASSGKSTLIKVVASVLDRLSKAEGHRGVFSDAGVVEQVVLCHGGYKETELFWTGEDGAEGAIPHLVRKASDTSKPYAHWVVLDGPLNAMWMHRLSPLLDSGHTLMLDDGQRIRLPGNMRVILETESLDNIPLSELARYGVVTLRGNEWTWKQSLAGWQSRLPEKHRAVADVSLGPLIETCLGGLREMMPSFKSGIHDAAYARALRDLADALYVKAAEPAMNQMLMLCALWATMNFVGQSNFDLLESWATKAFGKALNLPEEDASPLEYTVDLTTGKLLEFDGLPEYQLPEEINSKLLPGNVQVPTITSVRAAYLLDHLSAAGKHVVLFGPNGAGKSTLLAHGLRPLEQRAVVMVADAPALNGGAAAMTTWLNTVLTRHSRDVLGPPPGRAGVLAVDSLTLGEENASIIEMVRALGVQGGAYVPQRSRGFNRITRTCVLASITTTGGFGELLAQSPRLWTSFTPLHMPSHTPGELAQIGGTLLTSYVDSFCPDSAEMSALVDSVAEATLTVYTLLHAKVTAAAEGWYRVPLPSDVLAVFRGICRLQAAATPPQLLALWRHELARVFADKLSEPADMEAFNETVHKAITAHVPAAARALVDDVVFLELPDVTRMDGTKAEVAPPLIYQAIDAASLLISATEAALAVANEAGPPVPVPQRPLAELAARIHRVVCAPRSDQPRHVFLVGEAGSGRRNATVVAAHMARMGFMEPGYSAAHTRGELKRLVTVAAVDDRPIVGYIDVNTCSEAVSAAVLLVAQGGLQALFEPAELRALLGSVRVHKDLESGDMADPMLVMLENVKNNLHMVFAVDLSVRPSAIYTFLAKRASIIVVSPARPAPQSVAAVVSPRKVELAPAVVSAMQAIHAAALNGSAGTTAGLNRTAQLAAFADLYGVWSTKVSDSLLRRIQSRQEDIERILVSRRAVEETIDALGAIAPALQALNNEMEDLRKRVEDDRRKLQQLRNEASDQTNKAETLGNKLAHDNAEIEARLAAAQEPYNQALSELKQTTVEEMNQLRNHPRPSDAVMVTMEAMCMLFGTPTPTWRDVRTLLSDLNRFLGGIDQINPTSSTALIAKTQKYLSNPEFNPDRLMDLDVVVARRICVWIRSLHSLAGALGAQGTQREGLNTMEKERLQLMTQRATKDGEIEELSMRVRRMEQELARESGQKSDASEDTADSLKRAQAVVRLLNQTLEGWSTEMVTLEARRAALPGSLLVAVAMALYVGGLSPGAREDALAKIVEIIKGYRIPVEDPCSLAGLMATDAELNELKTQGCPQDNYNRESAVLLRNAPRVPLIVDPDNLCLSWLLPANRENLIKPIHTDHPDFVRTLEKSVQRGRSLIAVLSVGAPIPPVLDPVIRMLNATTRSRRLRIGDEDVDVSSQFRLTLITFARVPEVPPQLAALTTRVRFESDVPGTTIETLAMLVRSERPETQESYESMVRRLELSAKSEADAVLAYDTLIAQTDATVALSSDALINLAAAAGAVEAQRKATAQIVASVKTTDESRNGFRPVCTRIVALMMALRDMSRLHPLYAFGRSKLRAIFAAALQTVRDPSPVDLAKRLSFLIRELPYTFFVVACRSLIEAHMSTFAFLGATRLLRDDGTITPGEWRFFLSAKHAPAQPVPVLGETTVPMPAPAVGADIKLLESKLKENWPGESGWDAIAALETACPGLNGLRAAISRDRDGWYTWLTSSDPFNSPAQPPLARALQPWSALLLMRTLRLDQMERAMQLLVASVLGDRLMDPPNTFLPGVYTSSSNILPIALSLSGTDDPLRWLTRLAMDKGGADKLATVALGRGSTVELAATVSAAMKNGTWVLILNPEAAPEELVTVERLMHDAEGDAALAADFRLWVAHEGRPSAHGLPASGPAPVSPPLVLSRALVGVPQFSRQVRKGLRQIFSGYDERTFTASRKGSSFKKLMFGLAVAHAVWVARTRYGAVGASAEYHLIEEGIAGCVEALRVALDHGPEDVQFASIQLACLDQLTPYLQTTRDVRIMESLLSIFMSEPSMDPATQWSAASRAYHSAGDVPISAMRQFVESLPVREPTDLLGLHPNLGATAGARTSMILLSAARAAYAATGSVWAQPTLPPRENSVYARLSKEDFASVLEHVSEILIAIPARPRSAKSGSGGGGGGAVAGDEYGAVLDVERASWKALMRVVSADIEALRESLATWPTLTHPRLGPVACDLALGIAPPRWTALAPVPRPAGYGLSAWLHEIDIGLHQTLEWATKGLPHVVAASTLFSVSALFATLTQSFARRSNLPIDAVGLEVTVQRGQARESSPDVLQFSGMVLEGAGYDLQSQNLTELPGNTVRVLLPVVMVRAVDAQSVLRGRVFASLPVWRTPARNHAEPMRRRQWETDGRAFTLDLGVNENDPAGHWVRRGVALVMELPVM